MNNTTLLNLSSGIPVQSFDHDDSIGAIVLIVVVLLWYSSSIVFLLGMETIKPSGFVEDSVRHSERLFARNFHEKTNNKKILEELADKKQRDRLWKIYLGTSRNEHEKISQDDKLRIRNIRRQLATINERHRDATERLHSYENIGTAEIERRLSAPNISKIEDRARVRRQSDVDQEILAQWQTTIDATKINESWPWAIQKVMIRRQIRRQREVKGYESLRQLSIP